MNDIQPGYKLETPFGGCAIAYPPKPVKARLLSVEAIEVELSGDSDE
ncbi:MAG: hypothetical protein Q8S55_04900 [Methylococcaceae bacterium]|nr:hypothetical protein [Methylococcaceae bacterium]